jgi:putative hemolysin
MGVYSGENLTKGVENYLMQFEIMKHFAHNTAVGLVVLSVTYISIVLGELLPKRIAMTFPEPIAIILALPMKMLSMMTSPFVWLLTTTNDILLKILGIANKSNSIVSEEE